MSVTGEGGEGSGLCGKAGKEQTHVSGDPLAVESLGRGKGKYFPFTLPCLSNWQSPP